MLFIIHTWFCIHFLTAVLTIILADMGLVNIVVLTRLSALRLVLCMPTNRLEHGHLIITLFANLHSSKARRHL